MFRRYIPIVGCFCVASQVSVVASSDAEKLSVQVTGLNVVWDKYLGGEAPDTLYFVEVAGTDPSDEFLSAISGSRRRLAKRSEATYSKQDGARSIASGERGVIVFVGNPKFIDESRCELSIGYQVNGLGGAGGVFVLVLRDGVWQIDATKVEWSS